MFREWWVSSFLKDKAEFQGRYLAPIQRNQGPQLDLPWGRCELLFPPPELAPAVDWDAGTAGLAPVPVADGDEGCNMNAYCYGCKERAKRRGGLINFLCCTWEQMRISSKKRHQEPPWIACERGIAWLCPFNRCWSSILFTHWRSVVVILPSIFIPSYHA
jgi:hypothetical protein